VLGGKFARMIDRTPNSTVIMGAFLAPFFVFGVLFLLSH
jgi:hypothetical protein